GERGAASPPTRVVSPPGPLSIWMARKSPNLESATSRWTQDISSDGMVLTWSDCGRVASITQPTFLFQRKCSLGWGTRIGGSVIRFGFYWEIFLIMWRALLRQGLDATERVPPILAWWISGFWSDL